MQVADKFLGGALEYFPVTVLILTRLYTQSRDFPALGQGFNNQQSQGKNRTGRNAIFFTNEKMVG